MANFLCKIIWEKWLEIARKPAFFQKSCLNSKAKYELKYKNGIPYVEIENFCSKKNEISSIKGKAKIVSNRQLAVRFNIFMNLFNKVNYEIIFVDSEYKVAIVGSPDKKYLWILARNIIDEKNIKELLNIAKQKGDLTLAMWFLISIKLFFCHINDVAKFSLS